MTVSFGGVGVGGVTGGDSGIGEGGGGAEDTVAAAVRHTVRARQETRGSGGGGAQR